MLRTFLFLFCFITGIEASIPRNKTICLNMIVKDEAPVIRRCLDSVKPWIDYWIIVDTGSTDGTQEIIKEFMKDIPGELYERPWVNFGHNRDEALQLAENTCDYFMFVDADQELIHSIDSLNLDKDCYFCFVQNDGEFSKKILLANARCDWKWNGVLHEALSTTNGKTDETISGAYIYASYKDGHRAQDPQKHFKDIEILENAIKEDPNNGRYVLHLAQTYAACNELIKALENYEKRAKMGGFEEEVFWSLYKIAEIQELLNMPQETVINSYCKAYHFRPSRAEPLFRLADFYCRNKNYILGYAVAKVGLEIPASADSISVMRWMYDYGLSCAMADCAFRMWRFEEARDILNKVYAKDSVPKEMRSQVRRNLAIIESHIADTVGRSFILFP